MKEEVTREVRGMNSVAQNLHDYARTLIDKGARPFSKAAGCELRERGGELFEQIENPLRI